MSREPGWKAPDLLKPFPRHTLVGAEADIQSQGGHMLYYALVFLIVAIIAGLLGFGAISFAAAGIAKILFFIFIVLFLVSLVRHIGSRA
jgi:uncharacterized membrane protein YtjA (UPF0391 family)